MPSKFFSRVFFWNLFCAKKLTLQKTNIMGLTYATIELVNQYDEYKNQDGEISSTDIRRWTGNVMVDTGAIRLTINEEIRDQLGLRNGEEISVALADGSKVKVEIIGGVKIRFGNRFCFTDAFVLKGNTEPLIGCMPLEAMDLIVIPEENKLEYNHKEYDGGLYSLKGFKVINEK
jgi:clan AA aspartic protease